MSGRSYRGHLNCASIVVDDHCLSIVTQRDASQRWALRITEVFRSVVLATATANLLWPHQYPRPRPASSLPWDGSVGPFDLSGMPSKAVIWGANAGAGDPIAGSGHRL